MLLMVFKSAFIIVCDSVLHYYVDVFISYHIVSYHKVCFKKASFWIIFMGGGIFWVIQKKTQEIG